MNLYIIFGDGLTNTEAYDTMTRCKNLAVPYYSEYVYGSNRTLQNVAIGPITKGDIDVIITLKNKMSVWRLQNEY